MSELATHDALTTQQASWLRPYWPEAVAGLIWLVGCALLCAIPVSHDVVWQLWVARQMHLGAALYSQIIEVNPPLWFWMAMPLDFLAQAFRLEPTWVMVGALLLLCGVGLGLVGLLVREQSALDRLATLLGALMITMAIAVPDFAQREHLALIGAVPYLLLIARRADNLPVHWVTALAIGLFAAPFFALKHYFILVPLLLEIWLLWERRRNWQPMRPETIALVGAALLFAGAILVFAPEYLTKIVPLLAIAYGDFRPPILAVLLNSVVPVLLLGAGYVWHFRAELPASAKAAAMVGSAFAISYFAQFKGWSYHALPITATFALVVVLHLSITTRRPRLGLAEGLSAALLLIVAAIPNVIHGPYRNDWAPQVSRLLQEVNSGATAIMLTTNPSKIWPLNIEKDLKWPSRHSIFWMMGAVARHQSAETPMPQDLSDFVAQVLLDTVADMLCNPPDILIADRVSVQNYPDFDMLAFFRSEPEFQAIMNAYRPSERIGQFTSYIRASDLPAPAPGSCVVR